MPNLGIFTAWHSSPPTSHRKNFPPVEYRDLNRADISLLAPILAVAPTEAHSPNQTPLKSQIALLPPHLRATLPRLSTFCPHHRRLNPLPLISLRNAIRDEVLHELATAWRTNVDIHPAQAHFIDRIRHSPLFHHPRSQLPSNRSCAACELASMAPDTDLLIAVGAVVLAALSRRNWRKSRRVWVLQGLLGGGQVPAAAAAAARLAEGPVAKMLQLAEEWREIRRGLFSESERGGAVGPGEVVGGCPSRPERDVRQEGHVALVLSGVGDEGGNAGLAVHHPEYSRAGGLLKDARKAEDDCSQSRVASNPPAVPAKPTPSPSPYPSRQEDLPTNPGVSSSVYSVDEAEDATAGSPAHPTSAPAPATRIHSSSSSSSSPSSREPTPSISDESTILNLYHHSTFPPSSSSPPSSLHPRTDQTLADEEPQPLESSPRHHSLAPIWIPRRYYFYGGGRGEGEADEDEDEEEESRLATSALWLRRRKGGWSKEPPSGSGMRFEEAAAAEEEEGDGKRKDAVAGCAAKADACWVPGMAGGRWI